MLGFDIMKGTTKLFNKEELIDKNTKQVLKKIFRNIKRYC